LHLGGRAAVDQALTRLARRGQLMRIARGLYVRPVVTRFGPRAPTAEKVVQALGRTFGDAVVQHGATVANGLGLTTQVPVRLIYLTSGPSRRLSLGKQKVELRHAPPWPLVEPGTRAGDVFRALGWMGPARAASAVAQLAQTLGPSEMNQLAALRAVAPGWLAQAVSNAMVALD
ncbi:MAG TPA: DUF6088 family protein, partial [Caulobacteraceae bacterium]|nr:DUF6088 family protein [Caulobacteraceae bacterium]